MTDIPDGIMLEAARVNAEFADSRVTDNLTVIIARALLAAEKRGAELERERCARIAESHFDLRHADKARYACASIAAARMNDRITPYDDTCTIEQRIDEIVATGANVHIEMLGEDGAWMQIGDDIFTIYVERGKLFIAWRDNEAEHDPQS